MSALNVYIRRLEALENKIGVKVSKEKYEVDTSRMTKYEKGQYKCAELMATIREDTAALDDKKATSTLQKKAQVSNRIRKNLQQLKTESAALKKEAVSEKRGEDYEKLVGHVRKTENMYRQRFNLMNPEPETPPLMGGTPLKTFEQLEAGGGAGDLSESLLDPMEDDEFQQFYVESQQRNQEIDQGLERIHMGLRQLRENALDMKDELERQNVMLDTANDKAAQLSQQLKGMNGKLKETLKQVDRDKMCCYFICLILLVGLLGVILTQTGLVKF